MIVVMMILMYDGGGCNAADDGSET